MEPLAEPLSGSSHWRWIIFDADRLVRDAGQVTAWRDADLHAFADERLAEHVAQRTRRDPARGLDELAGLVCRVWRGNAEPDRDGVPVDGDGQPVEFGESRGDDWGAATRAGQAA